MATEQDNIKNLLDQSQGVVFANGGFYISRELLDEAFGFTLAQRYAKDFPEILREGPITEDNRQFLYEYYQAEGEPDLEIVSDRVIATAVELARLRSEEQRVDVKAVKQLSHLTLAFISNGGMDGTFGAENRVNEPWALHMFETPLEFTISYMQQLHEKRPALTPAQGNYIWNQIIHNRYSPERNEYMKALAEGMWKVGTVWEPIFFRAPADITRTLENTGEFPYKAPPENQPIYLNRLTRKQQANYAVGGTTPLDWHDLSFNVGSKYLRIMSQLAEATLDILHFASKAPYKDLPASESNPEVMHLSAQARKSTLQFFFDLAQRDGLDGSEVMEIVGAVFDTFFLARFLEQFPCNSLRTFRNSIVGEIATAMRYVSQGDKVELSNDSQAEAMGEDFCVVGKYSVQVKSETGRSMTAEWDLDNPADLALVRQWVQKQKKRDEYLKTIEALIIFAHKQGNKPVWVVTSPTIIQKTVVNS